MTEQPQKKRNLLLRNSQSPGDVIMLTAAMSDLHPPLSYDGGRGEISSDDFIDLSPE